MGMIRSMLIAFSMYSRIPVPRFEWKKEDMKYSLCFLPPVGAVIGVVFYAGLYLADILALPLISKICILSLIPLLVTGGFHVDGYLDVMDARRSYKPSEDKLKILKDPHIGAFAVISFCIYALIWTGCLAVILEKSEGMMNLPLASVFVLSRAGAAISSITMKKAREDGMLRDETYLAGKKEAGIMIAVFVICVSALCFYDAYAALALAAAFIVFYAYYGHMAYKEFGGVTGDTAGYFVCEGELAGIFALAVLCLIRCRG
jgi:adenosylcobinamide-GDP ribazoletransferase